MLCLKCEISAQLGGYFINKKTKLDRAKHFLPYRFNFFLKKFYWGRVNLQCVSFRCTAK